MLIVGICGSLQQSSSNLTLLTLAGGLLPEGVDFDIYNGLRDLPHFDPDIESDGTAPAPVVGWRTTLARADGLLIASPEYGHSLPGALKNGIDWVIGTGELEGKIVGVTASVNHEMRGRRGLDALLGTLAAVSARVVGGTPIVRGPDASVALRGLLDGIVDAVNAHSVEAAS